MNSLNSLLKNLNNNDIILGIILMIYIFGDYQIPTELAPYLTSITGYSIMLVLFAIALCNSNLLVVILLGISFILLIKRSNRNHPVNVMPSQNYRDNVMNSLNDNNRFNNINSPSKQELEELMVENISTINFRNNNSEPASFKPTTSTSNNVFEL
jgi:hypothetical protein